MGVDQILEPELPCLCLLQLASFPGLQVFDWLQYAKTECKRSKTGWWEGLETRLQSSQSQQAVLRMTFYHPVASSPGHSQILSRSRDCKIKSGSGLGMRLIIQHTDMCAGFNTKQK